MLEIQLRVPGCAVQTRRVAPGRYTIGRGMGADIRLRHPSVARRHALLSVDESETVLMDMGSADSIRRNGVIVSDAAPARNGDTFSIGDCELQVVRGPAEGAEEHAVDDGAATVVMTRPRAAPEVSQAGVRAAASATTTTVVSGELRALQEKLQQLVLRELDLFRRTALNNIGGADLRAEARQAIEAIIDSGAVQLPLNLNRARFVAEMTAEIMGYGPIEPFLADDSVSEVMVNGPGQIYVERRGQLSRGRGPLHQR